MQLDHPIARPLSVKHLQVWVGGLTIVLSFGLFLPELKGAWYLFKILAPFNLMLLVGAAIVLFIQGWRYRDEWCFSLEPVFQGAPLALLCGATVATLLARLFLDLEHLSLVGPLLGLYGVVGLFCNRRAWRRSLPLIGALALLIFLFALELTDFGHLARTAIAEAVEFLIKPISPSAISSEDILVLNTGIAFVDIPCSGFKNIEIGSLFFIAASLLTRKRMGWRWALLGCGHLALLVAANIARILVIVILTFILQQQRLAEVLHIPLGLCGFITVCVMTSFLLRRLPSQQPVRERTGAIANTLAPATNLRNALLSLVVLLGLMGLPQPAPVHAVSFDAVEWPTPIQTETIALTPQEQQFFARYPGVVTQKQTFTVQDISGSMIWVASPTWQAHHAPELCLKSNGLTIDRMQKQALTSTVTGRWLSLNQGQRRAAYWFQSPQRTTDRYLDRVWSEIIRRDPKWTMVSILFDQPVSEQSPAVQTLLDGVQGAIATAMT